MNRIHADGFLVSSNPSPFGGGYTLVASSGKLIERQIIRRPGLTSNEAELLGVLRAVELANPGDMVLSDSQVALTWIRKSRSNARSDLNTIIGHGTKLVLLKKLKLKFVPREKNLAGLYNERHPVKRIGP